ncbi:methylamine utilization protein [Rheinheimera texasensis]|uniref:methylamine utilization protein n=1 Tax=Rheinheimera texasensis TaxID=306205 RepID=UPI0004E1BF15|nr:methylamine utilization protein [Rheinheimera texasensis]
MSLIRVLSLCCCMLPASLLAAEVQIRILDQQGVPLADAVAELQQAQPQANLSAQAVKPAEVAQKDLTFVPFVSAVQKGTQIEFPNQDKTRHHVYSFSPAKVFELKLYAGKPEAPVLFDKAGVVALGCNIHDYMQAFVYVGDSPYLAVSNNDGLVQLTGVVDGQYQLKVWHPWQDAEQPTVAVTVPAAAVIEIKLPVTRQEKPQKPKKGFGNSYN